MGPSYLFALSIRENVLARVNLNGLPLLVGEAGESPGPASLTGGLNHALLDGENVLEFEVLRLAPDPPNVKLDPAHSVRLLIWTKGALGPGEAPSPILPTGSRLLFERSFPELWQDVPAERRTLPYYHRETFHLDVPLPPPVYLSAPPTRFGCEGTPELHEAVRRVHASLAGGDGEAFLDLMDLRFRDIERAYPGAPDCTVEGRRELFRREIFRYPIDARPLAPEGLHFESRAGGRVAYVTRIGGGAAIQAETRDVVRKIRIDPLLCFHQGAWRVFR